MRKKGMIKRIIASMIAAAALLSSTSVYAATEKFNYNSEKQVVEGKFQTSDNIVMLVIYTTAGYFDNGEKAKFTIGKDSYTLSTAGVEPWTNNPSTKVLYAGVGKVDGYKLEARIIYATCPGESTEWNLELNITGLHECIITQNTVPDGWNKPGKGVVKDPEGVVGYFIDKNRSDIKEDKVIDTITAIAKKEITTSGASNGLYDGQDQEKKEQDPIRLALIIGIGVMMVAIVLTSISIKKTESKVSTANRNKHVSNENAKIEKKKASEAEQLRKEAQLITENYGKESASSPQGNTTGSDDIFGQIAETETTEIGMMNNQYAQVPNGAPYANGYTPQGMPGVTNIPQGYGQYSGQGAMQAGGTTQGQVPAKKQFSLGTMRVGERNGNMPMNGAVNGMPYANGYAPQGMPGVTNVPQGYGQYSGQMNGMVPGGQGRPGAPSQVPAPAQRGNYPLPTKHTPAFASGSPRRNVNNGPQRKKKLPKFAQSLDE